MEKHKVDENWKSSLVGDSQKEQYRVSLQVLIILFV